MIASRNFNRRRIFAFVTLLLAVPRMSTLIRASDATTIPATPGTDESTHPGHPADVKALADEFREKLARSRYMEQGEPTPVKIDGWEGFPTRRYTYEVADKDGTRKAADVVLLDPPAEQLATWIVSALHEVHGRYDIDDGRKLFKHILSQSGGQFPVRGVVYEDILPEDGKMEVFCFRDGVTVRIDGVKHRTTDRLTDAERVASLTAKVDRVFTYARVASTSPEMWIAAGGPKDVLDSDGKPTQRWLDEVRAAYQAAWKSDRNALIVAYVRSGMK